MNLELREDNLPVNNIAEGLSMIDSLGFNNAIQLVEDSMLCEEQAPCPVSHHFGPGIYIREVCISAGVFAVGHYQKQEHLNIFLKGAVDIIKEDGSTERLTAPMIFTGKPGRKVGQVVEDMCWLNVYSTDEIDIAKLEEMFLEKSDNFTESELAVQDNTDFIDMLAELGFSEETVRAQAENKSDLIDFPANCSQLVSVSKSNIEGLGLFATSSLNIGDLIAVARVGDLRTPAGRYTNHSNNPNSRMEVFGSDIYLVAINDIGGCMGGQLGEEITVDYRQSVNLIRGVKICQG